MSQEKTQTNTNCAVLGIVGAIFVGILHLLYGSDVDFGGYIGRLFCTVIIGVVYVLSFLAIYPSKSFCFRHIKQQGLSKYETIKLFKECRNICIGGFIINFGLGFLSSIYYDGVPLFCLLAIPLIALPICAIVFNFNAEEYCNKLCNPLYATSLEKSKNSDDFDNLVFVYEQEKAKINKRIEKRKAERIAREALIAEGVVFDNAAKRPTIPRDVVDAVWIRDKGKCVYCGSTENLQLDHIIPFSKGGATTIENLQLLCQKCNVQKSNHIGNE